MSVPSSILAYKTHGTTPSFMRYLCNNHFVISPEFHDLLQTYELAVWDTVHFLAEMKAGQITYKNKSYNIIFKSTSRGRIMLESVYNPTAKIYLSFRNAKQEFGLEPVVLVSLREFVSHKEKES